MGLKYGRLDILEQYDAFTFVKGDLADGAAVSDLFAQYRPKVVVHLAALDSFLKRIAGVI